MKKNHFRTLFLLATLLSLPSCAKVETSSVQPSTPLVPSVVEEKHEEDYHFLFAFPNEEKDFLQEEIQTYLDDNLWENVTFEIETLSQGDVLKKEDWNKGPDLYAFCSGGTKALLEKGALREDNAGQYGYPYAIDTAYFLYYDKSLFVGKEEKLASLEGLLDVLGENDRQLCFALHDSYYSMAVLSSFGASYEVDWDMGQKKVSKIESTYDTQEGLLGAKALMKIVQNDRVFVTDRPASPIKSNGLGATIDGSWNYNTYLSALGENLGLLPLPSITIEEKSVPLKSFLAEKCYGVNPLPSANDTGRLSLLEDIAEYLASPEISLSRYEELALLPLEKSLLPKEKTEEGSLAETLLEQAGNAIVQGLVPEGLWEAPEHLLSLLEQGQPLTDAVLTQELLAIDDKVCAIE